MSAARRVRHALQAARALSPHDPLFQQVDPAQVVAQPEHEPIPVGEVLTDRAIRVHPIGLLPALAVLHRRKPKP